MFVCALKGKVMTGIYIFAAELLLLICGVWDIIHILTLKYKTKSAELGF